MLSIKIETVLLSTVYWDSRVVDSINDGTKVSIDRQGHTAMDTLHRFV